MHAVSPRPVTLGFRKACAVTLLHALLTSFREGKALNRKLSAGQQVALQQLTNTVLAFSFKASGSLSLRDCFRGFGLRLTVLELVTNGAKTEFPHSSALRAYQSKRRSTCSW